MVRNRGEVMDQYFSISKYPSCVWVTNSMIQPRIDSQYYKTNYVENEYKIEQFNNKKLGGIIERGDYGILPDSEDYGEDGIPLIRGTNLRNLTIQEKEIVRVPKKYLTNKSEIQHKDILILIKGATIDAEWSVSIVPNIGEDMIFNGSIFRIRLKSEYNPYFITAYMSTKYFLLQKTRAISNTGISYNDKNSLENFIIPIAPPKIQEYIGNKVLKAEELREEAIQLKRESEELFKSSLGIIIDSYNQNMEKHTWVQNEKINANNISGDYYKQIYLDLEESLDRCGAPLLSLQDVSMEIVIGNTSKISDNYCNKGIPYVTTKNIKEEGVDFSSLLFIPEDVHYNKLKKSRAFPSDILYNKSGNVGLSAILTDEYKEYNVVSDIIIIRPNVEKINPYYLVLYLNSFLGKTFSERMAGGAVFQHISIHDVAKIKVPILPFDIQEKIGDKKDKAELYNRNSTRLIEEARQDVEDLLEGNFDMSKLDDITTESR